MSGALQCEPAGVRLSIAAEPAECTIRRSGAYDCGRYTPGSIMIVAGTLVKYREAVQQVIYPDGKVVVLQSRDRYVLVVS
jgi:hypothetical protein